MNLWITSYILLYAKNIPLYLRSLSNSGNLPRTLNTIFWMEYLKSFVGDGKGKHIKADPGFTVDAVQSRDRAIKRIKLISAREAVNCNFVRVFIKVLKTTSWKDFLQVPWPYLENSEGSYFCNFCYWFLDPGETKHGFEQRLWVIYSNWLLLATASLQSPLHLTRIKAQPFFHVDLLVTMFRELARNCIKRSGGFSKSKSVMCNLTAETFLS